MHKISVLYNSDLLAHHNTHWQSPDQFAKNDPHLRVLEKPTYVYDDDKLIDALGFGVPVIYVIVGKPQISKSTAIKKWMHELIKTGINPDSLVFLPGERIGNQDKLVSLATELLEKMPASTPNGCANLPLKYIIIDKIGSIKNWDRGIKALADKGILGNVVLVLTGSDLILAKEVRMTFPYRRRQVSPVSFRVYPLPSFGDYKCLRQQKPDAINVFEPFQVFEAYSSQEDYLIAANDQEVEIGDAAILRMVP